MLKSAVRRTRRNMAVAAGGAGLALLAGAVLMQAGDAAAAGMQGVTLKVFASGGSLMGPDDITTLDGKVFVAFQNGVGSMGEPSKSGATKSTIVEYGRAGRRLAQWIAR